MKNGLYILCFVWFSSAAWGESKQLTFIHFNDLHSRFQGFSPTLDYSPDTLNDDTTLGGWARIATVINRVKANRDHPVLGLSAGDFSMGTLFHMTVRETGFELNLMHDMGIDITTFGNHEFDLGPDGLAFILSSAYREGDVPEIVYSNVVFDPSSKKDDSLEVFFKKRTGHPYIPPYIVKTINGVKVGFYGMMGNDAVEVSPFAKPVTFRDPIIVSQEMVKTLREDAKVDLVVFLSHGGIWSDKSKSEDEIVAREVDGIDIIVSGHTRDRLDKPLNVNDTIIVHTGAYGTHVGVLDLVFDNNNLTMTNYELKKIDDSIPGDPVIQKKIDDYAVNSVESLILRPENLKFNQIIAETDFEITKSKTENSLGNLVSDSIRWYINRLELEAGENTDKTAFTIETNGLIRDNIETGQSGNLSVADVFSVMPLGIGKDKSMGYPLVSFYVYASEIKDALEVMTSVAPLKGSNFNINVSGLKFTYNPNRVIFDRVTHIEKGDPLLGYTPLNYSNSNKKLYKVAANIYNTTLLSLVEKFTKGILVITPKDKDGNVIKDLKNARVDSDNSMSGVQEAKQWLGLIRYMQSFPDTDGDGISNIDKRYREVEGRIISAPSWHPRDLLVRAGFMTWMVVFLFFVAFVVLLSFWKLIGKQLRN